MTIYSIRADGIDDGFNYLEREARSVLDIPAIFISSIVDIIVQKLPFPLVASSFGSGGYSTKYPFAP